MRRSASGRLVMRALRTCRAMRGLRLHRGLEAGRKGRVFSGACDGGGALFQDWTHVWDVASSESKTNLMVRRPHRRRPCPRPPRAVPAALRDEDAGVLGEKSALWACGRWAGCALGLSLESREKVAARESAGQRAARRDGKPAGAGSVSAWLRGTRGGGLQGSVCASLLPVQTPSVLRLRGPGTGSSQGRNRGRHPE